MGTVSYITGGCKDRFSPLKKKKGELWKSNIVNWKLSGVRGSL